MVAHCLSAAQWHNLAAYEHAITPLMLPEFDVCAVPSTSQRMNRLGSSMTLLLPSVAALRTYAGGFRAPGF